MYNGIGLTTPRGSGTNGFVTRNLSAVRKTKEKVPDYQIKEDSAVRPFDPELVEHERRRQTEVRCMELRELLEEQEMDEDKIDEQVNAFRIKLLAEKQKSFPFQRDSSGRAMARDSHELSLAQEEKNDKAKNAFGIREDFIPGSSMSSIKSDKEENSNSVEVINNNDQSKDGKAEKGQKEKEKKRKKSKKRRSSSSSSSSSSSEDDSRKAKKRKKEKKKKSKKSHHHSSRRTDRNEERSRSRDRERDRNGARKRPIPYKRRADSDWDSSSSSDSKSSSQSD